MRYPTSQGVEFIKGWETLALVPYPCAAGVITWGYGHARKRVEPVPESVTEEGAEQLLARDITDACKSVLRLIRVPLTDEQFDALVSFAFNVGGGALQRSTLRQLVNREEHGDVPDEFLKWIRAGGKVLHGLVRRRRAEGEIYMEASG